VENIFSYVNQTSLEVSRSTTWVGEDEFGERRYKITQNKLILLIPKFIGKVWKRNIYKGCV
jgi:hypothetical protein